MGCWLFIFLPFPTTICAVQSLCILVRYSTLLTSIQYIHNPVRQAAADVSPLATCTYLTLPYSSSYTTVSHMARMPGLRPKRLAVSYLPWMLHPFDAVCN